MANYTYPAELIDRPQQLLATLGSLWSRTYLSIDQVVSYTQVQVHAAAQHQLAVLELIASMSRFEVPIFHRENWYLLLLRESELNGSAAGLSRFDETDYVFDSELLFDTPARRPLYAFPAPADLTRSPLIMNRITDPSIILTHSIDFALDVQNQALVFRINPFEQPLIAKRDIYENGEVVDREVALWLFRGEFDYQHIWKQFGYVLGLHLKSAKGYRDLMNALMDALVEGPTCRSIEDALSVITGIPLVIEPTETVEVLSTDSAGQLIMTNKNVYRFSSRAVPRVAVGDIVLAGQSLIDAFEVIEFNRGEIGSLAVLSIGKGLLANCYLGDLLFDNKEIPLEVDEDHSSGYTYLKFGLGGFPADVTRFFDDMHERGIIAYESNAPDACATERRVGTLAHLLDKRANRDGEPRAANLPSTINPLKFLVENVLRNHAYVVKIKVSGMGPNALGLYNVRHLYRMLPPQTALILVYEFAAERETIGPEYVLEGDLGYFTALDASDEVSADLVNDSRVSLRMISTTCQ